MTKKQLEEQMANIMKLLEDMREENKELRKTILSLQQEQQPKPKKEKRENEGENATRALTDRELKEVLEVITNGCKGAKKHKTLEESAIVGMRGNKRVALALSLQAQTGFRISDILRLKLNNFKETKEGYYVTIKEKKTDKSRTVKVSVETMGEIRAYAKEAGAGTKDILFNVTTRTIQKCVAIASDYLGLENISTHSFRKYFAMRLYEDSGHNIEMVSRALNHSNVGITRAYIGVDNGETGQLVEGIANRVNELIKG